ncbi:transmembrane protein 254 isoform X1 [Lampetra fluviatilis]
MAPQPGPQYFRRTGLGAVTAICLGLGLYTTVVLAPKSIPYESLGFFGSFLQYLTVNHYSKLYFGYYLTWIIHGVEALYTYKLAGYSQSHCTLHCYCNPFCCPHDTISPFPGVGLSFHGTIIAEFPQSGTLLVAVRGMTG